MGNWGETMARAGETRKLLPAMSGMEDTLRHRPVIRIMARVDRGWWEVDVQCEPNGPFYTGRKDRSYFAALAKSLDEAMEAPWHRAR